MFFENTQSARSQLRRLLEDTYPYCPRTRTTLSKARSSSKIHCRRFQTSNDVFRSWRIVARGFSTSQLLTYGHGSKSESRSNSLYLERELGRLQQEADAIARSSETLSQESVQASLEACELLAEPLADWDEPAATSSTATSNLLNLEEPKKQKVEDTSTTQTLALAMRQRAIQRLSRVAYSIITAPQVFITPELLSSYVRTQSLLARPEAIPPIFILYASKPIPVPNTSPIQYRPSNHKKASFAIPLSIAKSALDSAIEQRNLPVCFDIINTSVCASAFHRSKLLKRALVPMAGLALAPAAAYSAASQWSLWQDTMENELARNVMFAGLLAYVSFTATLGVVAVTTANDQMERVTWATGTPLRERWLREEERAMIDRVACAWGFQETWKRGEEEGHDWQNLREWTGLRRMVLDKVELMEGME